MGTVLRALKWMGVGLVALLVLGGTSVYVLSQRRFEQRFAVEVDPLVLPTDAASLEHGKHVAVTRGCLECHASQGEGRLFLDQMPVMVLIPPNITPGGATASYTNEDWSRAIRHGVRPDGSPILFMPCEDFSGMDDRDLGAMVAYLRTLPRSPNDPGKTTIGPLGRLLFLAGQLPLVKAELIDHKAKILPAPPEGATVEYGEYLAAGCTGCHGAKFSGGPIPGVPPEWPPAGNITPDGATGIGRYSEQDFFAVLREGKTPKGHRIDPQTMPWKQLGQMTDLELRAIFAYLKSLPARPAGGR